METKLISNTTTTKSSLSIKNTIKDCTNHIKRSSSNENKHDCLNELQKGKIENHKRTNEGKTEQINMKKTMELNKMIYFIRNDKIDQMENLNYEYKHFTCQQILDLQYEILTRLINSFLNTDGGYAFVGIENTGHVRGRKLNPEEKKEFKNRIKKIVKGFDPKVEKDMVQVDYLSVQHEKTKEDIQDLYVIRITVKKGDPTEIYCTDKGKSYFRLDGQTRKYTPEEYQHELLSRKNTLIHQENTSYYTTTLPIISHITSHIIDIPYIEPNITVSPSQSSSLPHTHLINHPITTHLLEMNTLSSSFMAMNMNMNMVNPNQSNDLTLGYYQYQQYQQQDHQCQQHQQQDHQRQQPPQQQHQESLYHSTNNNNNMNNGVCTSSMYYSNEPYYIMNSSYSVNEYSNHVMNLGYYQG